VAGARLVTDLVPTSTQTNPAVKPKRQLTPRTGVAGVLVALIVLFALFNSQTVTIHWIVTTTETPLIVVIAGCGLVGFAAGYLVARRRASRRPARLRGKPGSSDEDDVESSRPGLEVPHGPPPATSATERT